MPSILLARRLVELAPPGLTRVFFSDDGATAVEVALKMAFQYWRQRPQPRPEKTQFLSLQRAYHGDTLGDVSVGDLARFHHLFAPLLFPTLRAPSPYCYRCPLGLERSTCRMDCVEALADLVRRHADTLAAVVIEPLVQGAAGMITAPDGYLRRVRDLAEVKSSKKINRPIAIEALGMLGVDEAGLEEMDRKILKALVTSRQGLASWYMYFFQLPWVPERLMLGRDRSCYGLAYLLQQYFTQAPDAAHRDAAARAARPSRRHVAGRRHRRALPARRLPRHSGLSARG